MQREIKTRLLPGMAQAAGGKRVSTDLGLLHMLTTSQAAYSQNTQNSS
jgi:hypothetical protein